MQQEPEVDTVNYHLGDTVRLAVQKLSEEKQPYWVSSDLPWRRQRTPYRVFLAEFLLVRTRTVAVAQRFEDIVTRYPDLASLANADKNELADVLKPLGLKKRVPLLIKAAQYLIEEHNGQIPDRIETLIRVPGLGLYTSVAIAAFAYDSPEVPADVNILRFLSRITGLEMKDKTKGSQELRELLPFLSKSLTGLEAEHLLDFTRLVCRSQSPLCYQCPLTLHCTYFRETNNATAANFETPATIVQQE